MPRSYLRFPHLHGDSLVFVAEDDVWTAPLAGGRATRLTADEVPARSPRFSPDGTLVAWSSTKDGAPEIRVAEADGGAARRVTFWGDLRTRSAGWTPDGRVVATSATGQHTFANTWAYAVPALGGRPHRLDYGPVSAVAYGAGGVLIGRTMARDMAWWKRYRGGTAGKIWWDPTGTGEFTRLLPELDGQLDAPMVVAGRIAFLSDHEDHGNLYSVDLQGGDLRRHTDHGVDGAEFYARHASTDGERVVYESAGELYLLESLDAQPRRLDVRLGGPRTRRESHRVRAAHWVSGARPDHTGRSSVVSVRGTVHRLTHRDGPARTLLAEQGVRARLARPLGEDRAIWIDDASGEDAVVVAPLDPHAEGAPDPVRYADGQVGRVLELEAAPDGTLAALTTHDGRLVLLDTATGHVRTPARGAAGEIAGPSFSPDSRWLAYEDPIEPGLSRIMLVDLAGPDGSDALVAVTEPRFVDTDPVFTTDGRYLAFLSRRSFDPIYDEHSFDLTFPASWRPFLVPLAARTPSPFGAGPDGRPTTGADEEPEDPPAVSDDEPEKKESEKEKDTPPETVVDVEGLADRVVPIPVPEGRYRGLGAAKDCLLWLSVPVTGELGDGRAEGDDPKPVLERFDLKKRKVDTIADPATGYAVSGDGTRLVVRESRTLRVLRSDRSGSGAPSEGDADEFEIDTSRVSVTVDPAAEWRQMFDEAGRLMRDHYWVEDMAGVDWAAELERYRPLVDAVGSTDDLVDLMYETAGELGSSHAYVVGRGSAGDFGGRPGFLGADLEATDQGWRIARVLPPETSAPDARSPLSEPGVDVRAGDVLVEVGGRPVDHELGPNPLLLGRADTLTELTVRTAAGVLRRVVVRPLGGEQNLRYHDWVAGRRAFVADRSEGRLGYLHVPDMVASGWAQLHRDFAREARREGLVLDVRDNSGGHTSQLVIEKLARKVIGWDVVRHAAPATYPEGAPRGPIVLVVDEHAGSDGDIVTAAFTRMGLGPVVGTRTWGGVIGIDSRYALVDGTRVTQPRYSFWFDDLHWSVENHGVDPDVEVVTTPQDWVAGRDPQLETAVRLTLEALERSPAVTPPDPATRPSRAKRPLPPR
ncbi:S41 family peptidase [Pseudonocardia oroxyli]|uniref:Tricorn protease homolog n=1 Tax=Pseudonocardia oroxyli TaxID=366584 RepID=A0A1G7S3U8_PSEOR|nr:S41 family peptidase [Pseudonocardia oroxyli]SDG17735.1 tricorn protease [Pseudonocardia oroxyli]